jgi:type II secretory pathway pseudopilin PulG
VSLLEAIAALAIVGATSASVLAAVGAGTRATDRARRTHEAESLALEVHARLAVQREADLRVLPDSLASGQFAAPFDGYTWRATVRPDAVLPGVYQVQIDIEWPGGSQPLHTALYRSSDTFVADMP